MTDTNTEAAPKKGIPTWVIRRRAPCRLRSPSSPKIWRAVGAGIEGGEHVCQIYDGHSLKSAVKSMEGDKRFNYPKQYESIARQVLF